MSNPIANSDKNTILIQFKQAVIDKVKVTSPSGSAPLAYAEYLNRPTTERSGDEADAVDNQFTRYVLEWLGYDSSDWSYNRPLHGKKENRPDYIVRGSVGTAFLWEDKNSTIDFEETKHISQLRRYSMGTAGYAVWCNMRRILAIRFLANDTSRYEIKADINVEGLFGADAVASTIASTTLDSETAKTQVSVLEIFRLLYGKARFSEFNDLVEKICVDEATFESTAIPLTTQTFKTFTTDSNTSLSQLRLAALAQIREALVKKNRLDQEEKKLRQEWNDAKEQFLTRLSSPLKEGAERAIDQLTPRLGDLSTEELQGVDRISTLVTSNGSTTTTMKTVSLSEFSGANRSSFEIWLERATRINSANLALRFETASPFRIAEAYRLWVERQTETQDIQPEIFAEQVAYIFFIRLLLVRILEDKKIIQPRLASDGGFVEWSNYVKRHFEELQGVAILNDNFCNILTRKAGKYYLHFFQQAIFDWFNPDDYLLVVTLEFLCRYNFTEVTSDIIGFTYEEYIDRIARNRRGHFLTRTEVVDYMLDLLDYTGRKMIGRTILDPACGSGSFLVRAAYRYRKALVEFLCEKHGISGGEIELAQPQYQEVRLELAREYLKALTRFFYGMELNPFACYLAEMNLLIMSLIDIYTLQKAGNPTPIERFNIFNTNSLLLPREILDTSSIINSSTITPALLDRLSDRLSDEAYPLKAKLAPPPPDQNEAATEMEQESILTDYSKGFYFIVSNPPYINPSQVTSSRDYSIYPFFNEMLAGATNTYLLFLRLGLYYLASSGSMIYIVPLTILGDSQAANARKALKQAPFRPTTIIRFFSGNVLFPEVDQAVAIVRVDKQRSSEQQQSSQAIRMDWDVRIGGGYTIAEARTNTFTEKASLVLNSTPTNPEWQAAWLVSSEKRSYEIWHEASSKATSNLEEIWSSILQIREGDIRGDHINSLRISNLKGNTSENQLGDVAIYKGEDVQRFSLINEPSDYVRLSLAPPTIPTNLKAAIKVLERTKTLSSVETGLVIREIARLNTRERLIATWFERGSTKPYAFTHNVWRFILTDLNNKTQAKAFLALVSSKTIVYLLNLFGSNNHVIQSELARIPIPDPQTLPKSRLAALADALLAERAKLENNYVKQVGAVLPEYDNGKIYIPPSRLKPSHISMLTLRDLVMRGEIRNTGKADQKIKTLHSRGKLENMSGVESFSQMLDLFIDETERGEEKWNTALNHWQLPEPDEAAAWLTSYYLVLQEAQASWDTFVDLQKQVDEEVANWYGFNAEMKAAIDEGVPWARKRRLTSNVVPVNIAATGITVRLPVASSQIYAIGYEPNSKILEVEFNDRTVYQYLEVSSEIYQAFESATSKGQYFNQHIKGKYNSQKL
jgi:hypothetical protein